MYLRSLGEIALEGSGLTRPKPLLLLAYLAVEGPRDRRHLAELFWPQAANRMKSLGVALARIRREAPGAVSTDNTVAWSELECDAIDLLSALDQGNLQAAEQLYEGPFLYGIHVANWSGELEEWVQGKREFLAAGLRRALLESAEAEAAAGHFEAAGKTAQRAYALNRQGDAEPEELSLLHLLLSAAGSGKAAEVRAELAEFEPVPALSRSEAREELRSAPGTIASLPPSAVPLLPDLFGREPDLTNLGAQLADPRARLVTLLGPAGVGKTQLALHLAQLQSRSGRFRDGVVHVPLASVREGDMVPAAIAQSLEAPESPNRPPLHMLHEVLTGKELLLLLDNFEQVVAAAPVVGELLAVSPGLKVLVTSRIPLRLSAERLYPVAPLELPARPGEVTPEQAVQVPSVELFVERAKAVDPFFRLDGGNVESVERICVRLEGLPLALELAAARVSLFSPQAMVERLERRLDLLKGGMRDSPPRHRTLREALAWSYELLSKEQQALLRRLAVFVGGFTLEGAEAVAGSVVASGGTGDSGDASSVLDRLSALVENCLVVPAEVRPGEPRYSMLEMVREYAMELLEGAGEVEDARAEHANFFISLAEAAEEQLTGPLQSVWLDRLEADYDNLLSTLNWVEARDEQDLGYRLGAALWRFWIVRGHMREGIERLERMLGRFDASPAADHGAGRARARSLHGLGTLMHETGRWEEAYEVLERSLRAWREVGDKTGTAVALNSIAWVSCMLGRFEVSRQQSEEALELHDELGEARGVALSLNNMGWAACFQADFGAARSLFERSLSKRVEIEDRRGVAFARANLGWALRSQGCYEEAEHHLRGSLAELRELGDEQIFAWSLLHLGQTLEDRESADESLGMLEESLELWRSVGNHTGLAFALIAYGSALCGRKRPEEAGTVLHEALKVAEGMGQEWIAAWAHCELAVLGLEGEELVGAAHHLQRSHVVRRELGDRAGLAQCLEAGGLLALAQGRWGHAARSLGAAHELRSHIDVPHPLARRERLERALGELRLRLGDEFDQCWREGCASAGDASLDPLGQTDLDSPWLAP